MAAYSSRAPDSRRITKAYERKPPIERAAVNIGIIIKEFSPLLKRNIIKENLKLLND